MPTLHLTKRQAKTLRKILALNDRELSDLAKEKGKLAKIGEPTPSKPEQPTKLDKPKSIINPED